MLPRFTTFLAIAGFAAASLHAYTLTGSHWYTSTISMQLQLGPNSAPLTDGSASWGASAEDALATWNHQIGQTRFTVVRDSTAPIAQGNRQNNVFFSNDVYGQAWGTGVLAVTLTFTSGGTQSVECDVLFNQTLQWNSYRGALYGTATGTVFDFHRVAMHEFGHVLGLDHPDQAGQSVVAIMNSRISNLDTLASDDIAGAQSIYGANTSTVTAPTITTPPANQTVNAGTNVTFSVAVSSSTAVTYQWWKDGVALSGATSATLSLANVSSASAGKYWVVVTNGTGSVTSAAATLTVKTPVVPPAIVSAPVGQTVAAGNQISLSVSASGSPSPTFQWQKNGVNIAGATQATYVINAAAATDSGTYDVVITNAAGTVSTVPVLVTVNYSQLANLSARGYVPAGGALTAGFVLRGSTAKSVIVRGVGPALNTFGVADSLADPQLAVLVQQTAQVLAVNDSWDTAPQLATAFQSVGAFPLATGSADSASEVLLNPGPYTTKVTSDTGSPGIALAEVYDAAPSDARTRLINLSTLGYTGPGDNALVAGFSIQGNSPKRLLVRAIGPGLAPYNVGGTIANPRLDVFPQGQSTAIAGNDDWGGSADLKTAFTQVGAFGLSDSSHDAALVLSLDPGAYTVVVSGVANTTGNVLVEIYDLDP